MKKFTALVTMSTPIEVASGHSVSFYAIYDANDESTRAWAEATPAMNINMLVKKSLGPELEPGRYLLTFEKIEEQPVVAEDVNNDDSNV